MTFPPNSIEQLPRRHKPIPRCSTCPHCKTQPKCSGNPEYHCMMDVPARRKIEVLSAEKAEIWCPRLWKRLTYLKDPQLWGRGGGPYASKASVTIVINRLALYENSGRTPEETINLARELLDTQAALGEAQKRIDSLEKDLHIWKAAAQSTSEIQSWSHRFREGANGTPTLDLSPKHAFYVCVNQDSEFSVREATFLGVLTDPRDNIECGILFDGEDVSTMPLNSLYWDFASAQKAAEACSASREVPNEKVD